MAREVQVKTTTMPDPNDPPGKLKILGGSNFDDFNNTLAHNVIQSLWRGSQGEDNIDRETQAVLAALLGSKPADELEGMLLGQMIGCHNAAMECYRRAMIGEQTFEGRRENLAQANKLSRTYAALIEALDRYRGKGQQKVTVEHVHVHAGGQAVVGMVAAPVTPGGGDRFKIEEQPHAKQIAHAPEPALQCPDKTPDAMPISRDGERALSNAWGQGAGRAERE